MNTEKPMYLVFREAVLKRSRNLRHVMVKSEKNTNYKEFIPF